MSHSKAINFLDENSCGLKKLVYRLFLVEFIKVSYLAHWEWVFLPHVIYLCILLNNWKTKNNKVEIFE